MHPTDLAIIGLYILGILALGVAVSRRIGGFRDWFIAGGSMTTPVLVCTLVSTYYGLDVLFGASEVGFVDGVVGWFFYSRPYYVAILIAAVFFARRLRRGAFLSLPDVAAHAYGRGTQVVVAIASFVYALPMLAVMGIGLVLEMVLGVPFVWGVVAGAAISVVYTLLGGLLADALTDTVQFTLMCVTLGIAAALALGAHGGIDALRTALPASYFEPRGTYPAAVLAVFGIGALSVLVEPAFYQRIFAAESYRSVLVALAIGIVLWAAFDWIVTLLGMTAAAAGLDVEPRSALLALTLDVLPIGLKGLFVSGVIATAMSTIDSYLLIAGGNLSYDLYRPLARTEPGDTELLRLTRIGVVISAIVTIAFALFFTSMVSAWVFMASMLVSAALVPIVAALFFRTRLRPAAGLASSVTGLLVAGTVFVLTNAYGAYDEEWGTRIWSVAIGARTFDVWQEYAVLFALPASAIAFLIGQRLGQSGPPAQPTISAQVPGEVT
ncbi:MAG TPA: sodium:solute symporter family protein [Longimicrobiales bacterium]